MLVFADLIVGVAATAVYKNFFGEDNKIIRVSPASQIKYWLWMDGRILELEAPTDTKQDHSFWYFASTRPSIPSAMAPQPCPLICTITARMLSLINMAWWASIFL